MALDLSHVDADQHTVVVAGRSRILTGALRRSVGRHGQYRFRSVAEHRDPAAPLRAIVFVAGRHGGSSSELDQLVARPEYSEVPIYLVAPYRHRVVGGSAAADHEDSGPAELLRRTGHPHTVLHTSTMIGDSNSGAIDDFGPLYRLTAALLRTPRPRIPFRPDARVDVISCDVVADVVLRLLDNRVVDREYWLTGGPHALTVAQAVDELLDTARAAGIAGAQARPTYRTSASPDRDARSRGSAPVVDHAPETSLGDRFENALGELGSMGVTALPSPRAALRASLRYWIATGAIRAA